VRVDHLGRRRSRTDLLAVRCAPAIGVAGAFGVVLAGDDAADQRVWLPMG
jgi:methylthioribose-1-phosphate isomerase